MGILLTTDSFIEKAIKKHGNRYDYIKVDYKNCSTPVEIICLDHGSFFQKPSGHLFNRGCPDCGRLKNRLRNANKFLSYEEAKIIIHDFKIKNGNEWRIFSKLNKKPDNIPFDPEQFYKKTEEWISWGDFLGTGFISNRNKKILFLPYEEAKNFLKNKNFKTIGEYLNWCREEKCNFLPKYPNESYKDEFISWTDFLGSYICSTQEKAKIFLSYNEAKKYIFPLKLKLKKDYDNYWLSNNKPDNIPLHPYVSYKDEFISWADFLGSDTWSNYEKSKMFLTYDEAIKLIHSLKIKNNIEWRKYCISGLCPKNIPANPDVVYKKKGWISWGIWLGTYLVNTKIMGLNFVDYNEAIKFVHLLELKNEEEWRKYCKSKNKPNDIPSRPDYIYKNKGWVDMAEFLGILGNGKHPWKKHMILSYLKNTEQELNLLDPVELLTIINENKLSKAIGKEDLKKLLSTGAYTENRKKAIEQIIKNADSTSEEELIQKIDDETLFELEEAIDSDENETNQNYLTANEPIEELKMIDNKSIVFSLSKESIEFLIENRLNKLWYSALNLDLDIKKLRKEPGGPNFELIKKKFFEEYDMVQSYSLPKGYNFMKNNKLVQPLLMQKLCQHRLIQRKTYGNWTDTGGGKTLAAILAGRTYGAKNTLIICNNSTVDGWVKSINEYFLNNNIYVKNLLSAEITRNTYKILKKRNIVLPQTDNNYLILNYETFQQENGEDIAIDLLKNNLFDYIILDEVQNVKQREFGNESNRRSVVNKLLIEARSNNPEILTLFMTATPVINNLYEARMLIELLTGFEHNELGKRDNISEGIAVFKALTRYGLRYIPKYNISVSEEIISIDGSKLKNEIENISIKDIIGIEKVLLPIKLESVRDKIKKGTLIYTLYVTELIPIIKKFVEEELGYTVGIYSGNEKTGLEKFKSGEVQVLIGSAPVGTGVDGIQKVCDTLIPVCLPWTGAEWRQLKGRINRQGSNFDQVNIYVPQVNIKMKDDKEWSWDKKRFDRIKYKATLADLAVDGHIPHKLLPSKEKLLAETLLELKEWIKREEINNISYFERKKIEIPLNPTLYKKEKRIHGDFTKMNLSWSVAKSQNTYERLKNDNIEWQYYHTLYRESRKTWPEIPYIKIADKIKANSRLVVGDFGCGENLLSKELSDNKVHAFDYVAIDENVTACDISKIPLNDNELDIAVFSLSLMGSNFKDYLQEAYRTLAHLGRIYIAEPEKKWRGKETPKDLKSILKTIGFRKIIIESSGKFIYVEAEAEKNKHNVNNRKN